MLLITDGLPRGLGYLELDHRASDVRPSDLPGGTKRFECDTYTCTHCNRVVLLNLARVRERYKCRGCDHHICDDCAAKMATGAACKTYAQFVAEQQEAVSRSSIILP